MIWATFKPLKLQYKDKDLILKAAVINNFVSTVDQMAMCNMKGVARIKEPTDNYHPSLHFSSALHSVLGWGGFQLIVLVFSFL